MKTLKIIFLLALCLGFAACNLFDGGTDVTLKNNTDKDITFTYFSEDIDEALPVTVTSGEAKAITYRHGAESVSFRLTYDGKAYSGKTNYVQDSGSYTIQVYRDGDALKSKAGDNTPVTLTTLVD